jgi:hypothetical protein
MRAGNFLGCGTAVSCNLRGNETVPVKLRVAGVVSLRAQAVSSQAQDMKSGSGNEKPGAGRAFDALKFRARHIASSDRLTSRALQSDA